MFSLKRKWLLNGFKCPSLTSSISVISVLTVTHTELRAQTGTVNPETSHTKHNKKQAHVGKNVARLSTHKCLSTGPQTVMGSSCAAMDRAGEETRHSWSCDSTNVLTQRAAKLISAVRERARE